MRRALLLALAALAPACVLSFPDPASGPFACAADADCAEGYRCVAEVCAADEPASDAGQVDAAADAGEVDGGVPAPPDDGGVEPDAGPGEDAEVPDSGCIGQLCGVICVDLDNDPSHCGACNRSCLGGTCGAGVCQPYAIHTAVGSSPTQLAVDNGAATVYWVDQRPSGAVLRRRLDLAAELEAVATNQSYPDALVLDADRIYWSSLDAVSGPRNGVIRWADKRLDGAVHEASATTARNPHLAASDGVVFWSNDSPLHILSYDIDAATPTRVEYIPGVGSSFMRGLAADFTHVYWLDASSNVFRHPLNLPTGVPETVVANPGTGEPSDFALTADYVYWSEAVEAINGSGRIFKSEVGTEQVSIVVHDADPLLNDHAAVAIDVNAGYIYYVTGGSGGRGGSVFRAPIGTGTPERLYQGQATSELRDVAVGAGRVVWTDGDTVWALAL
ncbi:MAG: hypothetical protein H6730_28685 [Deltaproteobacteria bacterium]|nr:hypothetical protein [Deltaproteobacteria bacterium]